MMPDNDGQPISLDDIQAAVERVERMHRGLISYQHRAPFDEVRPYLIEAMALVDYREPGRVLAEIRSQSPLGRRRTMRPILLDGMAAAAVRLSRIIRGVIERKRAQMKRQHMEAMPDRVRAQIIEIGQVKGA